MATVSAPAWVRRKCLLHGGVAGASIVAVALVACSGSSAAGTEPPAETTNDTLDLFDVAVSQISSDLKDSFNDGDIAFSTPMREADGLGPLYTRTACDSCHSTGVRGP